MESVKLTLWLDQQLPVLMMMLCAVAVQCQSISGDVCQDDKMVMIHLGPLPAMYHIG